jgi:hypothetical protein
MSAGRGLEVDQRCRRWLGAFKPLDQFDWNHPRDIDRELFRAASLVRTNLALKQWSTVFPGAACVGALVDRFSHHCHPVDIDADSWRNKESEKFNKKAAPQTKDVDKAKKAKA